MYYTYILRSLSHSGAIYIGSTDDLSKRLEEHNDPHSRYYTKRHAPWQVETYLAFSSRKQAQTMEKHLKSSSGKAFMKKRVLSDSFKADLENFKNNRQQIDSEQ